MADGVQLAVQVAPTFIVLRLTRVALRCVSEPRLNLCQVNEKQVFPKMFVLHSVRLLSVN